MAELFPPVIERREERTLEQIAQEMKQYLLKAEEHQKEGAAYYRLVGERLSEAKAKLPHGHWLPWLKEHFHASDRQARRCMKLAKTDVTSDLEEQWAIINGNRDDPEPPPVAQPAPPSPKSTNPAAGLLEPPKPPENLCETCKRGRLRLNCPECEKLNKKKPKEEKWKLENPKPPPKPEPPPNPLVCPKGPMEKLAEAVEKLGKKLKDQLVIVELHQMLKEFRERFDYLGAHWENIGENRASGPENIKKHRRASS